SPVAWTISALALSTSTTARREGTTHRGSSVAFRTNDLPKPQLLAGLAAQSICVGFGEGGCGRAGSGVRRTFRAPEVRWPDWSPPATAPLAFLLASPEPRPAHSPPPPLWRMRGLHPSGRTGVRLVGF